MALKRLVSAMVTKRSKMVAQMGSVGTVVVLNGCYRLFIDNILVAMGCHQVGDLFLKRGKVKNVFIQRERKSGRRFHFGFVRYVLKKDALSAMKRLDGFRIGGAFLFVAPAKLLCANMKGLDRRSAFLKFLRRRLVLSSGK